MTTDQQIDVARKQIQSEFNRWLEFWAEKVLPPVVFRWARAGRHTAFVTSFCERHGIKIVNAPHNIQFQNRGKTIATFVIKLRT